MRLNFKSKEEEKKYEVYLEAARSHLVYHTAFVKGGRRYNYQDFIDCLHYICKKLGTPDNDLATMAAREAFADCVIDELCDEHRRGRVLAGRAAKQLEAV